MNRKQRKTRIKELVASRDLNGLVSMAKRDGLTIGVLSTLLYENDDLLRWRAIEALGSVAAEAARTNIASVRELLRKLEWLMNDESGGAGWHSPEAMAAIIVNVPEFFDTFGVILGSYLNDEPLGRAAHWAVAAMSEVRPDLFQDRIEELKGSLGSDDPWVRGYAVIALQHLAGDSAIEQIGALRDDTGTLNLYSRETGEMREITVGNLAEDIVTGAESEPAVRVW